jgi:hypothetical protein
MGARFSHDTPNLRTVTPLSEQWMQAMRWHTSELPLSGRDRREFRGSYRTRKLFSNVAVLCHDFGAAAVSFVRYGVDAGR